ncbi:MAG: hypothetical protein JSW05_02265 [Candidatus Thorarchaeota archaeon]|nr:MAG: hypothetical protein JSW05_02265 [Candidatus Thorarchaeota archaeon]
MALLVLFAVIPYYASIYVTSGNGYVWIHSLLWDYGLQSEGFAVNLGPLFILGIALVSAPGLVFTWRRQVLPNSSPLWESGLVAMCFTVLASLPFMFVVSPTPPGFLFGGFWLGMGLFAVLVVLGLILVPLAKWELGRIWMNRLKGHQIADLGSLGNSLFASGGALLLVLAIAAPNSVMFEGRLSQFTLGSVLGSLQFGFSPGLDFSAYGMMNPALVIPLSFLSNGLDFAYVCGVWNYGIHRTHHKATVAVGVAGVFFHMFAFPYMISTAHVARVVAAIPVLFVVGQMLLAYCDREYSRVAPADEL